ncbi:MAG TPA: hypothetical protein VHL59_05650 [Thermoanaerobaculia bacterium]|nr:hypothetical protein [Thermoanaerobaculia bacterium]
MNELRFEVEIARGDAVPVEVVRERAYGAVRVRAEWPEDLATPEIRVAVVVEGDVDRRDAPAYVELFFHDVFLLLNLATPASFGGTVAITGGELRVRELSFSPRLFAYAQGLERVPLEAVVAWYDRVRLGTRQVAEDGPATALFQLLHLARGEETEEVSILRLASAAEAVVHERAPLRRLFALRDQIARGRAPVFHPMHDDALDPSVEDATREWIEVADAAASTVIAALQNTARGA